MSKRQVIYCDKCGEQIEYSTLSYATLNLYKPGKKEQDKVNIEEDRESIRLDLCPKCYECFTQFMSWDSLSVEKLKPYQ